MKKILILIVVVIVTIIGGFLIYTSDPYSVSGGVGVKEFAKRAIRNNDGASCSKLKKFFADVNNTEESLKIECFSAVAVGLKDISLCENIPSALSKYLCYTDVAIATKNESLCDRIEPDDTIRPYGVAGRCFLILASIKKDISICERILDLSDKDECKSFFNEFG